MKSLLFALREERKQTNKRNGKKKKIKEKKWRCSICGTLFWFHLDLPPADGFDGVLSLSSHAVNKSNGISFQFASRSRALHFFFLVFHFSVNSQFVILSEREYKFNMENAGNLCTSNGADGLTFRENKMSYLLQMVAVVYFPGITGTPPFGGNMKYH